MTIQKPEKKATEDKGAKKPEKKAAKKEAKPVDTRTWLQRYIDESRTKKPTTAQITAAFVTGTTIAKAVEMGIAAKHGQFSKPGGVKSHLRWLKSVKGMDVSDPDDKGIIKVSEPPQQQAQA